MAKQYDSSLQVLLQLAENVSQTSKKLNKMCKVMRELIEQECEMMQEMKANKDIQLECDSMPF